MATVYFGVDVGGHNPSDVTVDTSTTSLDIELTVDDTAVARAGRASKDAIDDAIEAIRLKLQEFDY